MKTALTFRMLLAAWLLIATAAACVRWQPAAGEGSLSLVISGPGMPTKTLSDNTAYAYEEAVNQVQLLLFKGGQRYDYLRLDAASVNFPYTKQYPALGAGVYQIFAVANGPDLQSVTTEAALRETTISLTDCGLSEATGFVMMAGEAVQISPGEVSQVTIPMQRYVARVRVTVIRNRLPAAYADGGAMTLKGIFLINALQDWNLGTAAGPHGWVNLGGRVPGRASSTNSQDYIRSAEQVPEVCRSHLYRTLSVSLARGQDYMPSESCLYTFPNAVIQDHPGPEATESTGAPTRLVVLARVNGADWWYPVTLVHDGKGLERNTTYDVALTICASGSADPNEPVTAARLTAQISCSSWSDGPDYSEPL